MNEEVAIIPLNVERDQFRDLMEARAKFGLQRLAELSYEELRQLQRRYYERAQASNLLTIIHLVIRQAGTFDPTVNRYVWRHNADGVQVEGILDGARNRLDVTTNNFTVCRDYPPGEEIFVPGQKWLTAVLNTFDRLEVTQRREAEQTELRARRDLIEVLSANV